MSEQQTPDPHLTVLTQEQADFLRGIAVGVVKYQSGGLRPTTDGTAVIDHRGRRYPLVNLAQRIRGLPLDQWPEEVAQHFGRMRAGSQGDEGREELLRGTRLRLLAADALPDGGFHYTRPVADGLIAALALDTPTTVRILDDPDVEQGGGEQLWAAARANLLADPVERSWVAGPTGAPALLFAGESLFVASLALVLPEAMRAAGVELPEAGALLAMPTRHRLGVHPITDHLVVDAVNDLGGYALHECNTGPGSLTPRLYWWRRGGLEAITVIDEERRELTQRPPEPLLDVMRALAARTG
ncbi:hypothetical protein BIV57_02350 [Mangrovactinospora gilvigrisea]|uniref:Uncharacterized protein n=1 Tax=Mangrovactinospora gilvigrisea TaxID=1428644 RepID=A0A1J7CC50_9ACTN|nr:hypothetical protein [Mangrovactinospora gilvigrisea]OIV39088.1 hypothetical protein BIV57_02350 [Mangrovactinospora gilvigrisea]